MRKRGEEGREEKKEGGRSGEMRKGRKETRDWKGSGGKLRPKTERVQGDKRRKKITNSPKQNSAFGLSLVASLT